MAQLPITRTWIERTVFGVTAIVLSGAMVRLLSSGNTDLITAGDRRFEVALLACYGSIFAIGVYHLGLNARVALFNPALVALLSLACVSCLWAELPGLVLRRSLGIVGTTVFGLVMATTLDFEEQLGVLRRVARVTAALSYIAWPLGLAAGESTVIKGYQIEISEGAWRGIFNHKNDLGQMMALAILMEWHIPAQTRQAKIFKSIWMCAYAGLLVLSHSVTSLVSVGMAILLLFLFKGFRHQYRVIVPLLLLVTIVGGLVFAMNTATMTGALGRSADLSGRGDLWHWVALMIARRPVLGYGYSGFWKGASAWSTVVEDHIGWSPVYAHDGYLEIILSLGFVGLGLFLWFVGTGLRRAVHVAKCAESTMDLWPLAFLVFFLIHNLAECTILYQNTLEWAVCVATVVGADPRLRSHFAAVSYGEEFSLATVPEYS